MVLPNPDSSRFMPILAVIQPRNYAQKGFVGPDALSENQV
jgi:hypothetical protein